jgi:hypothetical protein
MIHDRTLLGPSLSLPMLERLLDRSERTGEYVRHLQIGPFKDEGNFDLEILPVLETILKSVSYLQDFTWRMSCDLPIGILDLLHKLHPSAKLHLILRNRKFQPLNRNLLSSPQLYTLDTEIYATIPNHTGHSLSELSFIKHTVPASLQVLRLSTLDVDKPLQRAQLEEWSSVRYGMLNFDFQPGERFPALLELALRRDEFALTEENCNLWARATSWERLQRLDLPGATSPHFIASLTNRAINLKYLRFHISAWVRGTPWRPYHHRRWSYSGIDSLSILASFLASIKSLHTLDFAYKDIERLTDYLRVMLQSLGGSLKSLTISDMGGYDHSGPIDYTPGMTSWSQEHYKEMLELAPGLEHLDAHMGMTDRVVGSWKGKDRYADAEKKWKTAKKNIRFPGGVKIQRAQKTQKLIW